MKENPFEEIIGEKLSSVTFVMDYLQICFDGPIISLYIWPIIISEGRKSKFGDDKYRDEICFLIAMKVKGLKFREMETLEIIFENSSKIIIPLNEDNPDITGTEILSYVNSNNEWFVI